MNEYVYDYGKGWKLVYRSNNSFEMGNFVNGILNYGFYRNDIGIYEVYNYEKTLKITIRDILKEPNRSIVIEAGDDILIRENNIYIGELNDNDEPNGDGIFIDKNGFYRAGRWSNGCFISSFEKEIDSSDTMENKPKRFKTNDGNYIKTGTSDESGKVN